MQKTKLILRFNKMEEARLQLYSRINAADKNLLQRKPKEGKWNTLQIIFHMNSSEEKSVAYISKKILSGNSIPKTGLSSSLKSLLLTIALKYFKFKKPAMLPDPPEDLEVKNVLEKWSETRNQLSQLIISLPEDLIDREIFKHPRAGKMNMYQALKFMDDHVNHHLKQVDQLIGR
ncbi:MAG: DinB family protein [Chitinophagales bacterium]|nr:DinB family protein [Chitinophagales bacterium]